MTASYNQMQSDAFPKSELLQNLENYFLETYCRENNYLKGTLSFLLAKSFIQYYPTSLSSNIIQQVFHPTYTESDKKQTLLHPKKQGCNFQCEISKQLKKQEQYKTFLIFFLVNFNTKL